MPSQRYHFVQSTADIAPFAVVMEHESAPKVAETKLGRQPSEPSAGGVCNAHQLDQNSVPSVAKRSRWEAKLPPTIENGNPSVSAKRTLYPMYPVGYPTFGSVAGGGGVPLPRMTWPTTWPEGSYAKLTLMASEPDGNWKFSTYPVHDWTGPNVPLALASSPPLGGVSAVPPASEKALLWASAYAGALVSGTADDISALVSRATDGAPVSAFISSAPESRPTEPSVWSALQAPRITSNAKSVLDFMLSPPWSTCGANPPKTFSEGRNSAPHAPRARIVLLGTWRGRFLDRGARLPHRRSFRDRWRGHRGRVR